MLNALDAASVLMIHVEIIIIFFYIYNKLSKLHVQNTIVFHNYDKIHKDSGYRTFIN